MAFLFVWLILGAATGLWNRLTFSERERRRAEERRKNVEDMLDTLTSWQRSFLARFVAENRRQIPEWEVGPYRAVWGPEMDVLVQKGIIHAHRGGLYEIEPIYWDYLTKQMHPATDESA